MSSDDIKLPHPFVLTRRQETPQRRDPRGALVPSESLLIYRGFWVIYRIRGTYLCKAKRANVGSFSVSWQRKNKTPTSCLS